MLKEKTTGAIRTGILTFTIAMGTAASAWDTPTIGNNLALIFPDDSQIETRTNTTRSFHRGVKDLEPVLQKDRPWEMKGCHVYGSVYKQSDGSYRMWYNDWELALVADSKDGKIWTKPYLNVNPRKDYPTNNLCRSAWGHCISLIDDKFEKDYSRRYKFIGCIYKYLPGWEINRELTGYYTSTSSDGLIFSPCKRSLYGWDTVSMVQHPETGEIFVYHKVCTGNIAGRSDVRRIVLVSRTKDFINFSKPEVTLAPDETDDESFTENPNQRMDIYTHTAFAYAGGFIGFPTMFRIDMRKPSSRGETTDLGPCNVQLVTSEDGVKWNRTPGRKVVLERGTRGRWDGGGIWGIANGDIVTIGNESSIYYYGLDNEHGRKLPERKEKMIRATGRATWRRWGFASIGSTGAGSFTTKSVKLSTADLRINMRPEFDPYNGKCALKVLILSADGNKVLCESENLDKDEVLAKIVWKNRAKVPVGRPVKIKVDYHSASVFAFECL